MAEGKEKNKKQWSKKYYVENVRLRNTSIIHLLIIMLE